MGDSRDIARLRAAAAVRVALVAQNQFKLAEAALVLETRAQAVRAAEAEMDAAYSAWMQAIAAVPIEPQRILSHHHATRACAHAHADANHAHALSQAHRDACAAALADERAHDGAAQKAVARLVRVRRHRRQEEEQRQAENRAQLLWRTP